MQFAILIVYSEGKRTVFQSNMLTAVAEVLILSLKVVCYFTVAERTTSNIAYQQYCLVTVARVNHV